MTNQELISTLESQLEFTEQQGAKIVDATVTLLRTKLENNHSVEIEGLGFFKTLKQPEYETIDAIRARKILMPPRIYLTFSTEKIESENLANEDSTRIALNLYDLIKLLAATIKIQETEAESFLRTLVSIIVETVKKDEAIEIKNFGTFSLAKESHQPNLQTKDLIAAFSIHFVADKVLEDAINRPFAHFESVELEDGVSFDMEEPVETEINTEHKQTIQERISSILSKTKIEPKHNELSIEEQDTGIPADIVIEEEKETEEQEETTPIEPHIETVEHLQEEQVKEEGPVPVLEIKEEVLEIPSTELETSTESSLETKMTDIQAINIEKKNIEKSTYAQYSTQNEGKGKKIRFFILFLILLIILSCLLWYFSNTQVSKKQEAFDKDNKDLIIYNTDTLADGSAIENAETQQQPIVDNTNKEGEPQATVEASPKTEMVADTKAQTITIRQGDTMRSLGLKHYGNKLFWVYIYQENKALITEPNNIPLGTRITIASRTKYGIDANNAESLKKAQNLEVTIFADMKLK